jgi:transketolase
MRTFTIDEYKLAANVIRGLSIDGIQNANSGHPGLPLGIADVASVLWLKHLNTTSANSQWLNRDRFVLSGGHGSMLLYSLQHLSGFPISIDDLKQFRQLGSKTPGHPEKDDELGIETTTGPLGQGIANAVGLAIAQKMLAERFNTSKTDFFNNFTYVFCGDGDMMEGISHEACSFAGHLKLGRLIMFYDSNRISIEGDTDVTFTEDVEARFKAYGWETIEIDGHDYDAVDKAILEAKGNADKAPTLIICKTIIGKGSPNRAGTAKSHGEPLGVDEVKLTKQNLGLPADKDFYVPAEVHEIFKKRNEATSNLETVWKHRHEQEILSNSETAAKWNTFFSSTLPEDIEATLPVFDTAIATRAASGTVIQTLAQKIPNLVGGSADLSPSTKTWIEDSPAIGPDDFSGRNFQFGVRELAMAGIQNGMIAYGGLPVFSSTFFVFSDYMRPCMRVAAISGIPAIYIFTHDSFYVGEDGPTHEPVEQLASLRAMPNITLIRPADSTETGAAWLAALRNSEGPTAIMLTRQNLPIIDRTKYPPASMLEKGAYTLFQNGDGIPELTIIASGSEVALAMGAVKQLDDINVRLVNMPSWELFEKQSKDYRDSVLDPKCTARLAIEAGSSFGWSKYVGTGGAVVSLDTFGDSAPYKDLEKHFGFTPENVVAAARSVLA